MTITAVCTSCGRRVEAPAQFAGKKVKCKGCGTIFQIPAAPPPPSEPDTELDPLEELERTAGGTEIQPPANSPTKARIGPKLEKKLQANPDAEEFPINTPVQTSGRANVMRFRYPGAKQIDQGLPLILLLLGLLGLAAVVAGTKDPADPAWISCSRYIITVLFYLAIIFPVTTAMLRKAAVKMRYRLPPNPKLRAFGIYMPAFALAACFWFAGSGSGLGLIMGLLFGLALSSAALWLLFRLREEELPTSLSYGAGGFLLGTAISIGLIIGLNALALLMVNQAKAQAKVPTSPISPGLAWNTASPVKTIAKKSAPTVSVPVENPVAPPNSPVIADLQTEQILNSIPVDAIIRPFGQSPIVGILHTVDGFAQVDPWNSQTMQRPSGTELRVSLEGGQSSTNTEYQISTDGKRIAWISQLPRLSVKIWSFDENEAEMKVLDRSRGTPRLLGFFTPATVLIRWDAPVDSSDTKPPIGPPGLKPYTIQSLNTDTDASLFINTKPMSDAPASLAINIPSQHLAAACVDQSSSTLVQYDLHTGLAAHTIAINEVDPIAPAGLAYSGDGQQLAILFEYPGGALLLDYDAKTGKQLHNFVYTVWPPAGISTDSFKNRKESAITWLDSSNLLLYGQGIVDSKSGKTVANLSVPDVVAQRVLGQNEIELLTNDAKRITLAKLDREKLNALLNPPTTPPSPAP